MNRLSVRIAAAVAAVALAAILAVGGALFVSLRDLHRDQAVASLGDIAQPLVARIRLAAVADLRRAVSALETELRDEILAAAIVRGRVVDPDGDMAGLDLASIPLDDALRTGQADGGSLVAADGTRHLYAATIVRPGTAAADASAIVLATVDRSGALALRDVLRVLPGVVLVVALVALPVAWLLGRSVTRPLRRLADATADVPAAGASPLPESGPAEVRELVGRFNAMTAELERARAEERELLANVRHDLRTPLTVVAGFAEALRDGTVAGDAVPRAGRAIAEEAERMQRLIDDLETADDARASGRELRPEPLDGGALVAAAAERFAGRASATGATLRAQTQAGAGSLAFAADRAAVERILANLVDNALRAIPAGGTILLEALPSTAPAGGPAVALRVSDDGPGFPPGAVDRVFDRFYRGDPSRAGTGAGLGLAIVRTLARAHGGDAVAENLAPTGARVTVTLPAVPVVRESA